MDARMKLGRFIAIKRNILSITQEQLAEKVHVSKSAIGKWETDRGVPDYNNLCKLAEALEEPLDVLICFITNEPKWVSQYPIDITPGIIQTLESYGYTVISPADKGGKENEK